MRHTTVSLLHHAAEFAGALPITDEEHTSLLGKILLFSAWGQVGGGMAAGLAAMALVLWIYRRRRLRRKARS